MSSANRRQFLNAALAGGAALLAPRSSQAAEARIEILPGEVTGTITPDLYGHFTEHIGGVIYDGIWVGEGSKIPNQGGIRSQLVEYMRKLKTSVIRWPGGCFADSYDWRDGVGARANRPRRVNFWADEPFMRKAPDGPQKFESNQFGTNEFARFCKLCGAEPYLAANLRSLRPIDFTQWIEYCNSPAGSTSLGDARAANGDREPFNVRYWGVGNESWGCGGDFSPEEYAVEYRRWVAWAPRFGLDLRFVGSGPHSANMDWTPRFFHKLVENGRGPLQGMYGWALHHYSGSTGNGQAVDYPLEDWYELLKKADRMESLITDHWRLMGEVDTEHRVKLIVDEWGAWHRPGTEVDPSYLFGQMPTMRDAVISAITLDIFNRHCDKVAMGNVAQLINNLHCLFLAREDRFTVTTNYHVFQMYTAHYGGKGLRTIFSAPSVIYDRAGGRDSMFGLAGSASLHGSEVVLTVVNPHASEAQEARIEIRGARVSSGEATVLNAPDVHAHNSFSQPDAVKPRTEPVSAGGGNLVYRFQPASVTRLRLNL